MPSSRLSDGGSGAMPRKVAELLRSEQSVADALDRFAALVRSKGLSPRVVERILVSSPQVSSWTLLVSRAGTCGQPSADYASVAEAAHADPLGTWRAGAMACWAEFVVAGVDNAGIDPRPLIAAGWANAETAYWCATHHIVDPDDTFVGALLIDAGLIAMVYALPEVYSALAAKPADRCLVEFEQEAFGFDHQEVSAAVLRLSKFPEETEHLAANHHAPLLTLDMSGKVVRAAMVAAAQAGAFGFEAWREPLAKPILDGALLKPEHQPELLGTAKKSLQRALSLSFNEGSQAA